MNPSFSSYLVNDVFGDPGVYIEVRWSKRALLFDLGENSALGPTRLLRANDIFISHTHMDHFIGFDAVLRVALGRGKTVRLYGPPSLIANVKGKLNGYTWNLVDGYPLTIEVKEFHPGDIHRATFRATDGFMLHEIEREPFPAQQGNNPFTILEEPRLTVKAVALNHRIPSFAYSLEEPFHINVNKQKLHEAGLPVGSWLKDVKQYLWQGQPDTFGFPSSSTLNIARRSASLSSVRSRKGSSQSREAKRSPTSSTLDLMKKMKRRSPTSRTEPICSTANHPTWTQTVRRRSTGIT